jgi:hypothetical protein
MAIAIAKICPPLTQSLLIAPLIFPSISPQY